MYIGIRFCKVRIYVSSIIRSLKRKKSVYDDLEFLRTTDGLKRFHIIFIIFLVLRCKNKMRSIYIFLYIYRNANYNIRDSNI